MGSGKGRGGDDETDAAPSASRSSRHARAGVVDGERASSTVSSLTMPSLSNHPSLKASGTSARSRAGARTTTSSSRRPPSSDARARAATAEEDVDARAAAREAAARFVDGRRRRSASAGSGRSDLTDVLSDDDSVLFRNAIMGLVEEHGSSDGPEGPA